MDEHSLRALVNGDDDGLYALDNVMLEVRDPPSSNRGGGASRPPPEPEQFVSTAQASATLRGAPQPAEEDGFDTSCDELEEEEMARGSAYIKTDDDFEDDIDALFDEPHTASARANQSARTMDQMLNRDRGGRAARDTSGLSCFGCVFSSRADVRDVDKHIDGDKMNSLIQIFDDGYSRIDSRVLAKMCHEYFKNEIYAPLRARGIRVVMWRTREIFKHFTEHQLDPRVFLVEQIRSYKELSAALRLTLLQETSGGSRVKPNNTNVALQLRVDQHLLRLRGIDPGKLNFHNPVCTIDFADKGKLMNPMRDFAKP